MIAKLLISSLVEDRVEEISKILSFHFPNFPNHPDILYFEAGKKLGIEQARAIKNHFSLKPHSAKGRAAVLEDASVLTPEAQNALLKTLEEPPEEAILILGVPSENNLLPTILSRCQIVILRALDLVGREPKTYEVYGEDVEQLLNSTIKERFEYIERLKNREEFLHVMVAYFRKILIDSQAPRSLLVRLEVKNYLQEILQAEQWAAQNVNIRAILEYLMLVMPGL